MDYGQILSKYHYAELRIERSADSLVSIKDEEVKHSSGFSEGVSVRVLENGSWGFASSNNLNDIEMLLQKAHKLAALNSGKIKLKLPPQEKKESGDRGKATDGEGQIKELLEAGKLMKAQSITSRTISSTDSTLKKEFYNSQGSEIIEERLYTYVSCTAIAKSEGLIQRGSERAWSRSGFGKINLQEIAEEAKNKAIRLLTAGPPPKGRFTVVLDPEMTGVFSHEAVGHACEADSVVDRESILAGKLGKKIGNELVTIVDDPTANDFGGYRYDDEGVEARPATLIDKGILKTFMNSMETAQELGLELNGHTRAGEYSEVPIIRMSNTYFQKGDSTLNDVFDVRDGVYLKGMRGGSVDIFSGGFMFKAEEAYEIKNGEKQKIMRDVTISGNILQTMLDVECVGNDFGTSPGICGKMGQEAPVSDGGPHIRIKNVAIG
ncbi:Zinc metalloprotease TldD [Candidatus Bilamarchaeum dharawalense]|uniref:Zinc metalloprotease TldD n=1 Tax=Candidatus Bilamarchaeum dharawalense TaxID=2885759 RepID=A0A5E4LV72_9ARCH|nr:Zinc metalloprotease TldD [Candidatus Bilamarchaeum dharawalense]